jgi:hypothetical protein
VDLVQEVSNLLLPLLELCILLLNYVQHNRVGPGVLLSGQLQLRATVIQPMLDLAQTALQ